MINHEIIPHLFRTEYSKLVAVLSKTFGLEHIEIAEDIASETFLLALDSWPYKGAPANPTAWLYIVAGNKVKNYFKRNTIFRTKVAEKIKNSENQSGEISIDFSNENIADSQLQMIFTVCHPSISTEAQLCLALRVLCGLGLDEIADAFLSNKETIHKRLQRAKEKLHSENIKIELPPSKELSGRLDAVLQTIYLLFSEGYYSERNNTIIRKELCVEAMNLCYLLSGNTITNTHSTNALMSLMCFHSSRFEARQSESNSMVLYEDQDVQLWNTELIEKGFYYLQQASKWEIASKYYIEASIAYWHTVTNNTLDKWTNILNLYDALLAVDHSPMAALNRIVALSKVRGNKIAIVELEKMNLKGSHFYFILLAELYKEMDPGQAISFIQKAISLCKTGTEKEMLKKRIQELYKK